MINFDYESEYSNYTIPTLGMIRWFATTYPEIYLTVMNDVDVRNHVLEQLWAEFYL